MRWGAVIFVLAGCTGELEQQVGLFEPIRVPAGEFIEEEIVEVGSGPAVTSIAAASGILNVGQQGRSLVGRTTADAYAVALRLEDVGTGWWVRPVQDEDPMYPGERDFALTYDVGAGRRWANTDCSWPPWMRMGGGGRGIRWMCACGTTGCRTI